MAMHSIITPDRMSAASTGLLIAVIPADPIPGLASRPAPIAEAAEQARAMNAVLAALSAILDDDGGAHV